MFRWPPGEWRSKPFTISTAKVLEAVKQARAIQTLQLAFAVPAVFRTIELERPKPLTPNGLARLLKMFKIQPSTMRLEDGSILKGYRYQDFVSVFESYGLCATVTPLQSNSDGHFDDAPTVTPSIDVTVAMSVKPTNDADCNGVTVDVAETEDATWTV